MLVTVQMNSFCTGDDVLSTAFAFGSVHSVPLNAVESLQVLIHIAKLQLNVDIAANKEINSSRLPARMVLTASGASM